MPNQTLKNLGFNDKEIRVYLALLKTGKMKPSTLAKVTKLNRATLYNIANSLLSKGVIAEDATEKSLHFVPLPPDSLGKILDQTKRDLEEKEILVKKAIGDLNLITAQKTYPVPKITFIEENHLEKYLFDSTERWQEAVIASDGIWWGYQDQSFAVNFEKWIHSTWKTSQSKHHHYKPQFFCNDNEIEKKLAYKYTKSIREMKSITNTDFTANTWIAGNSLVMIVTDHHPFYLIEIQDDVISHNTREIFKKLWGVLD